MTIQLRRDTAANWSASNPVLSDGQPGYDKTNGLIKIGDGVTAWNSLASFSGTIADGDKGDITVSGSGTTWAIDADTVTFSKIQNVSTASFLGRQTAGTGDVESLTAAQAKTLLAITSSDVSGLGSLATASSVNLSTQATGTLQAAQAPAHTGDVTSSAGSLSLTIPADTVTNSKLANMAANTIKGNNTGGSADPADLTASQVRTLINVEDGADVTDSTNVAAAGAVMESDYTPAHSILVQQSGTGSPSALQVSNNTLIGRLAGGGSNIADLSGTEATTLLDVFTSLLKGVVPASGGGTANFLRADGSWAAPSGISAAEYYARQTQYFYGDNL